MSAFAWIFGGCAQDSTQDVDVVDLPKDDTALEQPEPPVQVALDIEPKESDVDSPVAINVVSPNDNLLVLISEDDQSSDPTLNPTPVASSPAEEEKPLDMVEEINLTPVASAPAEEEKPLDMVEETRKDDSMPNVALPADFTLPETTKENDLSSPGEGAPESGGGGETGRSKASAKSKELLSSIGSGVKGLAGKTKDGAKDGAGLAKDGVVAVGDGVVAAGGMAKDGVVAVGGAAKDGVNALGSSLASLGSGAKNLITGKKEDENLDEEEKVLQAFLKEHKFKCINDVQKPKKKFGCGAPQGTGGSPLHKAIELDNKEVINILLKRQDLDTTVVDSSKKTAVEKAQEMGLDNGLIEAIEMGSPKASPGDSPTSPGQVEPIMEGSPAITAWWKV